MKKPLVSVIIPTRNSSSTLKKTLNSLVKQTYSNIEIVVSDGFSNDNTVEIAKKVGVKITYGKELIKARYEGLKKANGKYAFALDSDQFIGKNVIERCVNQMEAKHLDALILNERSIINKGKLIERLLSYDKEIVSNSRDANPLYGAVIPRFFNRKTLLLLKWPKNISILDDAILFEKNKKKLKIGFLNGEGIIHNEVDSWKVFFKKFKRYGLLYIPTMKVSSKTTVAHSIPRRAYFRWEVIKRPNMFFGVLLLYVIKAFAVVIGIGQYFIQETIRSLKVHK